MSDPIQIVLIDDNPDDRALVTRELHRTFKNVSIEQVTTLQEFERLLESAERPEMIITDYQLRWNDGLTVLRAVKKTWPDSSVIMFTGTGSEEIAVEAMKSGLDDYVLKTPAHYSRLAGASQTALKLAAHRRELKEAENRYSLLFDSVPVGLYHSDPNGKIVDANPALAEMLGYSDPQQLVGAQIRDLYSNPEQYQEWKSRIDRDGVVRNFETRLRCQNANACWVKDSSRAIRDARQRVLHYEGCLEDITEQKRSEEEREKLIVELQDALAKIKTLSGLLPICSSCKKIRDDKGYWNQIEVYIESHSDAEFTHSFCPECVRRLYPEITESITP